MLLYTDKWLLYLGIMTDRDKRDDDDPTWSGTRGIEFTRWQRDARPVLSSRYAAQTEDFSHWDVCEGVDAHGDGAGAIPIPAGVGALGAHARRRKRQTCTWSALVKMQSDQKIKNMLLALNQGDVAAPGGGFQGIGRRAMLLLREQGDAPIDDEYIRRCLLTFDTVTLLDSVGYGLSSITKLVRYLANEVALVPAGQQPDDNRYACRVLDVIIKEAPDALSLEDDA